MRLNVSLQGRMDLRHCECTCDAHTCLQEEDRGSPYPNFGLVCFVYYGPSRINWVQSASRSMERGRGQQAAGVVNEGRFLPRRRVGHVSDEDLSPVGVVARVDEPPCWPP